MQPFTGQALSSGLPKFLTQPQGALCDTCTPLAAQKKVIELSSPPTPRTVRTVGSFFIRSKYWRMDYVVLTSHDKLTQGRGSVNTFVVFLDKAVCVSLEVGLCGISSVTRVAPHPIPSSSLL
jgi:hypothetical protein